MMCSTKPFEQMNEMPHLKGQIHILAYQPSFSCSNFVGCVYSTGTDTREVVLSVPSHMVPLAPQKKLEIFQEKNLCQKQDSNPVP